jgi:hypothetical protein
VNTPEVRKKESSIVVFVCLAGMIIIFAGTTLGSLIGLAVTSLTK